MAAELGMSRNAPGSVWLASSPQESVLWISRSYRGLICLTSASNIEELFNTAPFL